MADFVAVIRRTVDGLSDNVPEMRAKVYEKARGAVRRQLENMKPRPSDEMIERQMVKLEAAINEVESDHAEALPALDDAAQVDSVDETGHEVPADVAAESPTVEEPAAAAETGDEEREERAPEPAEEPQDEPALAVETPAEPVASVEAEQPPEMAAKEDADEQEIVGQEPPEQEPVGRDTDDHEVGGQDAVWQSEPVAETEEGHPHQGEAQHAAEFPWPKPEHHEAREPAEPTVLDEPDQHPVAFQEPQSVSDDAALLEEEYAAAYPQAEPVTERVTDDDEPAQNSASEWALPEWNDPVPATAHNEVVWTERAEAAETADEIPDLRDYEPVETVTPLQDDAKEKGSAESGHSWAWDDSDPFTQGPAQAAAGATEPAISDWSWPVEKPAAEEPDQQNASRDTWTDIDALLEQGGAASAAGAAAAVQNGRAGSSTAAEDLTAPSRPVSYRAEPRRSRFNLKVAGIAAAVLLATGGAGYAYWQNQAAVHSWLTAAIASITAQVPGTESPVPAPDEGAGAAATPENSAQTQTPPGTDVAALGSSSKFTQRLQPDGTELDQGPAPAPAGENATEEGKSVAAQTEAGKPQETADAAAGQAAGSQPVQPASGQQTASNPATQQIPAGAQKMFLYEERLGQSAPTAIEGNVAWSVKEESPGGDAKPEPVIQAQINVPERGLTALMTIKRNADSSLPASHVIEFVFSLPENFEGGSIDSVQRVAMKRNEQDRGDPLIAVPAKITDDFHMIALNDFAEAVATNTELLRSRSWIDIPLTYRNGRRALLTLEKGPAGTDAFTNAMQAWSLVAKPSPAVQ